MAWQGNGTETDPYLITNEVELNDIRNYAGFYFQLNNDIILVSDWTTIPAWNGFFNGGGHKITNFNCTNLSNHVGFIGSNSGILKVHNLEIHGGSIGLVTSSSYYCGYILAVQNGSYECIIQDCLVNGKYTPGGDRGAGAVGITQTTCSILRVVANCEKVNNGRGNGLVYRYSGSVDCTGSYYNSTLCSVTSSYGGETYLTTAEFAVESNFPGLDFVNTWKMTGTMPELRPDNLFYFSGTVKEEGAFVSRDLNFYTTATGEFIGSTTSSGGDGTYEFITTYNESTFIVCFDDEAGTKYNALIETDVYPIAV